MVERIRCTGCSREGEFVLWCPECDSKRDAELCSLRAEVARLLEQKQINSNLKDAYASMANMFAYERDRATMYSSGFLAVSHALYRTGQLPSGPSSFREMVVEIFRRAGITDQQQIEIEMQAIGIEWKTT